MDSAEEKHESDDWAELIVKKDLRIIPSGNST